jgi:cysteamine dioxygenase
MGKNEQDGNRKRKRVPSEVISFIENLERHLEIRFSSNDVEGSHLQHDRVSSEHPNTRLVTHSPEMNNVTCETQPMTTPFSGAMELIERGLENVDAATLRQTIDPIWQSLESLDAVAMLDLKQTDNDGARVSDDVFCKPIHDLVTPLRRRKGSIVRYVHVSEVPEKYSVGIFIFPPNARIPLHDHPGMCVLSRVLYGDLQRLSLDLARENQEEKQDSFFSFSSSRKRKLPNGSRRAYLNQVDHLQAPDVTALYPFEGQLHEFQAGPNGAAVLDVLLPPYDETHDRDCTFYHIRPDNESSTSENRRPCWIVPTGQPEDFHCLSGRYNELGGDFYDSDDDSSVET